MRTLTSTALLGFVLTAPVPLYSQAQAATDSSATPIATDRPTVTNSSIVVPDGSFQAENGFLYTDEHGVNIADAPETLIRFGLAKKTELRLYVPDYYYNVSEGGGPGSGFGDLAVGVKQQLGPTKGGFDVSATVFVSFPTGAANVTSGGYDPGLQVAWSHGLSSKWTGAGMLSLYAPTVGGSHDLTGEVTFYVDRALKPTWDAVVEYVGDFPERGGTRQFVQFASELRVGKRQLQQIDFHYGVGITPAAPYHFIGVGYSFRFRAVHHR